MGRAVSLFLPHARITTTIVPQTTCPCAPGHLPAACLRPRATSSLTAYTHKHQLSVSAWHRATPSMTSYTPKPQFLVSTAAAPTAVPDHWSLAQPLPSNPHLTLAAAFRVCESLGRRTQVAVRLSPNTAAPRSRRPSRCENRASKLNTT